jgi:hypothetical protein
MVESGIVPDLYASANNLSPDDAHRSKKPTHVGASILNCLKALSEVRFPITI